MGKLKDSQLRNLCLRGVISTTQFCQIRKRNKRVQRSRKVMYSKQPFKLSNIPDSECLNSFRFTKLQLRKLTELLGLPDICTFKRLKFTGIEGLCILLCRLSYPNRLCDLVKRFHREASAISKIFNFMTSKIYMENVFRLQLIRQNWMDQNFLENSAKVCSEAGSWYDNIVGFIDGTSRPICRPKYNQRTLYSGYKKQHVLKYQSVVLPNGLIARLDGPFVGRRHDAAIVGLSKIRQEFEQFLQKSQNENFALYGDPGYSNSKYVKVGFRARRTLTAIEKSFNKDMSALRVSVEYGFGRVIQQFAFLDFKKNQKVYLQNLKRQYFVAAFLTNCQICMVGSQVSEYFNFLPPTIEKYLQ